MKPRLKTRYRIRGIIIGKGTGRRHAADNDDYTEAWSAAQALRNIAKRYSAQWREEVYTGNCHADALPPRE